MTLLWSSGDGSGTCSVSVSVQDTAFTPKTHVLQPEPREQSRQGWSTSFFGMGNPFRPLTRQSRSPTRPVSGRRASSKSSTASSRQQHLSNPADPAPSPPTINHQLTHPQNTPNTTNHDTISARASKRIKLSVRDPAIASPATSHGHRAKQDDSSGSDPLTVTPRPPTRLTFTRPKGTFIQTTNGVQTTLQFSKHAAKSDSSPAPSLEVPVVQRKTRTSADRRSLRSQDDGPRLKSELAVYFPYYEDIIYDAPKEPELLNTDAVILLYDDPKDVRLEPKKQAKSKDKGRSKQVDSDGSQVTQRHLASPLSKAAPANGASSSSDRHRFNGAQIVDFSSIERSVGHHPRDPLTDAFYFKSHRRAERKEKQLRNIEKERAMHEKAQLERLLDGLKGHDWLRMMGITGITDTEAKKFESKRDYFIGEVEALLDKFRKWKEEERRLKLEKEAAAAAEEEAEMDDEEDTEAGAAEEVAVEASSSDLDGAAARQLQLEASSDGLSSHGGKTGKGAKGSKGKQRQKPAPQRPVPPPVYRPASPEGPFTSFYAKPHLRAAALSKARHGRNPTAFGQPLPDMPEMEFALPEGYVTAEAIKESARRRRRMKRESMLESSQ